MDGQDGRRPELARFLEAEAAIRPERGQDRLPARGHLIGGDGPAAGDFEFRVV
ncbi:MAG: hypothetical protein ACXWPV_04505 [Candidatus Limnocylindrales bacterium]